MLRTVGAYVAVLLLLGSVATLAVAGVPKVVILEEFGATW